MNTTTIRSNLEERDVDVTYLIENGVPIGLLGDYSRLKNILLRLLTNAIKATVQGEIIIWVKLSSASAIPSPPVATPPTTASRATPYSQSPVPVTPLRTSTNGGDGSLDYNPPVNSGSGRPPLQRRMSDLRVSRLISPDSANSSPVVR